MPKHRVSAFIEYVLTGLYDRRENKSTLFLTIGRNSLTRILGGKRLGSAQKEEIREVCRSLGIAFSELADRWIFFSPEDVEEAGLSVEIDDREKQLIDATNYFEKLTTDAADEEWKNYKFSKVA